MERKNDELLLESMKELTPKLNSLTFEDMFDVDNMYAELSKYLIKSDLTELEILYKSFDNYRDSIKLMEETISETVEKSLQESCYMIGKMSGLITMIDEVYKILLKQIEEQNDLYNRFLKSCICCFENQSILTHQQLANALNMKSSGLTMSMKRNPQWKKYISSYVNPNKHNSVIYTLNTNGRKYYESVHEDLISLDEYFKDLTKKKYDYGNQLEVKDYGKQNDFEKANW